MGVPTWCRLGPGSGWMCMRRRSSRRCSTRESGELCVRRLPGATSEVVGFCAGLPGPVRVAYEAGPTGFGLARALEAAGVGCVVAAPGKIERPAQDRVKTDRRDAERLVRLLMIGGLHRSGCRRSSRGGAARPGARARGRARRSDARPAPARASCCCATTCASTGTGATGRSAHRGWLARSDLDEPGAQVALRRLSRRDRRADGAPRRARAPRSPSWCPARHGPQTVAAAALPARHRHALGGRAVRRGRRLRALRRARRS